MQESDVMAAAVHAARASPSRLQALHHPSVLGPPPHLSMPHPLHPLAHVTSMEKYHGYLDDPQHPSHHHHHHIPFSMAPSHLPPPPSSLPHSQHIPLHSHHPLHPNLPHPGYDDDEFVDEEVDEDEMSDLEEELQQELLAYRNRQLQQQQQQQQQQQEPDMTRQLLNFADLVSGDIQKFFGRKKGDEESCDVYEDKWVMTKSGRELYYADLLRMAQGDFGDSKSSKKKNRDVEPMEDNVGSFTGKADASAGLGGLETLFDLGLSKGGKSRSSSSVPSSALHHSKKQKGDADSTGGASSADLLPMNQRKFPSSFWKEPDPEQQTADSGASSSSSSNNNNNSISGGVGVGGSSSGVGVIVTNTNINMTEPSFSLSSSTTSIPPTSSVLASCNKLPDFSDLMESWHGGVGVSGDHHPHHQHLHHQQHQQHYQLHQLQQQQQQLHHLQQLQASAAAGAYVSSASSDAGKKRR